MQFMRTFGPKGHLLEPVNRGGSDYCGGKYNRKYRRCVVVDDYGDNGKEGKEGYAA